jgi:hypothetical protein
LFEFDKIFNLNRGKKTRNDKNILTKATNDASKFDSVDFIITKENPHIKDVISK